MLLSMPLLLLFLSVVNAGKVYDDSYLKEAKLQKYIECTCTLMCDEKKYDEFLKLSEYTKGKECHEYFMGSLTKAYLPGAESTLEYWKKCETFCDDDEGTKTERIQSFGRSMGQPFEENNCESNTEHPICQCFFGLFEKAEDIFNHYIDIGVCKNPGREVKKLENMA